MDGSYRANLQLWVQLRKWFMYTNRWPTRGSDGREGGRVFGCGGVRSKAHEGTEMGEKVERMLFFYQVFNMFRRSSLNSTIIIIWLIDK